jgi:hypothetical protein
MAYNLHKGTVSGSVDQHGDQEIEGVKVFKNVISASVFYDTDAESPCATENRVAISTLVSESPRGLMTYEGDKIAKSHYNLTFDGKSFIAPRIIAGAYSGSAGGLKDLSAMHIAGLVPARSINCGHGLYGDADGLQLRVENGPGIKVDSSGVSVYPVVNGGLGFKNNRLTLNFEKSLDIQEKGQNISDGDLVILQDMSRGDPRHSTMQNLYEGYIKQKVPHPAGVRNSLQYRGNKEFEGSPQLTFDPRSSTLSLKGDLVSLNVDISTRCTTHGDLEVNGALFRAVKTVSVSKYNFDPKDNTVLFDTGDNKIIAVLPRAKDCPGRVLTIKKICSDKDKYKVKGGYALVVRSQGETIDFRTELSLTSNYSVRTLQSDGNKWWIINRSGS